MQRRAEFRPFSWLHDLWRRDQLDLSPPYQRRSVWSEKFRHDFVTTVTLNYPCPAIFLYEEIRPDGTFNYKVVDGKQRLTTLLDFVTNKIPVPEDHPTPSIRGLLFDALPDETKLSVWRYQFSVEFVEQENENLINDIFNRINKNVAKLSQQELRHALFNGVFITAAEQLTEYVEETLPPRFPNIAPQSRRQMKDVENVSLMLLFIENGERSVSQSDLDKAYRDREEDWPNRVQAMTEFRAAIDYVRQVLAHDADSMIINSRLKNQADFYSLFAAIVELDRIGQRLPADQACARLVGWLEELRQVEQEDVATGTFPDTEAYLAAARAASNDAGPRRVRIDRMKAVLS